MRNDNVAEWILSLVTTPDRAASTVGDLIESRLGAVRFWSAIGSRILRSLTWSAAGIAVAGFIAQYFVLAIPVIAIAYFFHPGPYLFRLDAILACLSTQILVGHWIARNGKTQALGICLVVVLIDCALGSLGSLRINNANINMAVWSAPLLMSTIVSLQSERRALLRRLR